MTLTTQHENLPDIKSIYIHMHIQSCTSWTYTKGYGIKSCKMYTRFAHVFSVVRYQEIYPYLSGFTIIWNSVWCACKRGQYSLDTELYLTHISHDMMICIQFVGSSSPKMIWFTCKLRWWGQNYIKVLNVATKKSLSCSGDPEMQQFQNQTEQNLLKARWYLL